ncbi:MAG: HDOD domain-containing protein [Sedimenticolaceae bacterium]
MDIEQPLYQELIAVESIPPMPATAATLLTMAADPDVEIEALALVIERDPPLSARLLGLANSAFYAPRQPVMTVKEAIVRVLGLNMVRNLAFGMALAGAMSTAGCPRFDLTSYWVMALGTADLARGMALAATTDDAPDPDVSYMVGLLHNLGELLLVHLRPREMDEALRRQGDDPGTSLVEHERAIIGLDHWVAGAFLARHWQLPPIVGASIERFDDVQEPGGGRQTIHLVRAARLWLAEVVAGRPDTLRVAGVDEVCCDRHSTAFLARYEALRVVARSMA